MPNPLSPASLTPLVLSLGLAFSGAAVAEEVRVSLTEALSIAATGNSSLRAVRERALAAHARADQTDRLLWPRVNFNSDWSRTNNAAMVFMGRLTSGVIEERDFAPALLNDPRSRSQLATRLSIEAPIDPFGRLRPIREASQAMAKSVDAASREHALELRQRVTEVYALAAVSQERSAVVEAALAAARARETEIEALVSEGAALRADLLRVKARRREREAELASLAAERAGSLAILNEMLGSPADTTYVTGDLPSAASGPIEDENVLIARALSNRPGLEALKLQAEAATHKADADRKSRLPEMGVFAQLTDDRGGFSEGSQSYAVGGFFRVSLFDPARNARQAEALINARASELDHRAQADNVRRSVRQAREQVRARIAAMEAARGGAEEGQEALRVVQERRREGLATLTDELETEAAVLGAHLRELAARVELAVAEAALARVTGETK